MTDPLEPIEPHRAVELYLGQRESEVAASTLQSHRSRLRYFPEWCELEGIDNMNDLTGRKLHEYRSVMSESLTDGVMLMPDAESVAARPTHPRPAVVKIVDACEKLLDENGRTYVRAAHLDVEDATSYQIGRILALLADSAETVAELYELEKAAQLEISRWGPSGGTTRWEISWIESRGQP